MKKTITIDSKTRMLHLMSNPFHVEEAEWNHKRSSELLPAVFKTNFVRSIAKYCPDRLRTIKSQNDVPR